ncbi:saccharopine dehydrogenase [Kordiimonas sp.]|uniref:saccharopine dehydrogenase n=1 Tax=Kordiimonas sp. TaxID=1970157 RepID=UPI003A91A625
MKKLTIWLRDEARTTERRTPLLPEGAKELMAAGIEVVIEKSDKRIFTDALYADAGCTMASPGDWETAPTDAVILGLKELPPEPRSLIHSHIYFAHAFKKQSGWQTLLSRFLRGGGSLLDIEYMKGDDGRRVAAFGFWAGYMGAALALMQWYDRKAERPSFINQGLRPSDSAKALDDLIKSRVVSSEQPTALVIGAGGRSGSGAIKILERHGVRVTKWGRAETKDVDREAILNHDILINCAYVTGHIPPFLAPHHIKADSRLKVISDVSCDPFSDYNPLPLYSAPTCWKTPAITAKSVEGRVDLIAVDNLPSLLPMEASIEFATMMLPYLKTLVTRTQDPVWVNCAAAYQHACDAMTKSEVA